MVFRNVQPGLLADGRLFSFLYINGPGSPKKARQNPFDPGRVPVCNGWYRPNGVFLWVVIDQAIGIMDCDW